MMEIYYNGVKMIMTAGLTLNVTVDVQFRYKYRRRWKDGDYILFFVNLYDLVYVDTVIKVYFK